MNNKQDLISKYKCPICENTDTRCIGYRNGQPYSRKFLTFKGEEAKDLYKTPKNAKIFLSNNLSEEQQKLSNQLITNYRELTLLFMPSVDPRRCKNHNRKEASNEQKIQIL